MQSKNSIKCPNCGMQIDVNEILYHELENQMQKKFQNEVAEHRKKYKDAIELFKQKEEALKEQEEKFQKRVDDAIKENLKKESKKIEDEIRKNINEENKQQIEVMQKELREKTQKVIELNTAKAEIEKLKREKEESETKIKFQIEQEYTKKINDEREKIKKEIDAVNELKFKQKDEQLEQLKKQAEELQRKAEQGSTQLQGEVQEIAIEEWLKNSFPFDVIEEIKKGQRGGDCLQIVHTRELQNCGSIYYESKRTKDFQFTWIEKFKADMREKGANIGVLVTHTMPNSMKRMGLMEGIWICSYEEFKGLSYVLRENIISLAQATKSEENKSDKMNLLYSYLTSNEFKMQIEAIVEGFTQMQGDLNKEKNAMIRIWKQREKQLTKVLENTIGMYGSIRGIAGSAIAQIKTLELEYDDNDESLTSD